MVEQLQISYAQKMTPTNHFLKCEPAQDGDTGGTALEESLFDFASTDYEMGARVISIPPNRFFAEHTHPYAHHFIFVLKGTGIMIYDGERYTIEEGGSCLVRKGVIHKLGAADEGLLAICVNTPTYEHDDPNHVHYLEEETLGSVTIEHDAARHVHYSEEETLKSTALS
jgi:quercetin dioxygenase-like cupin family protein